MAVRPHRILICVPLSQQPMASFKSLIRCCDICGCAIWVAQSSPKATKRWCTRCAEIELDPARKIEPMTAEQIDDIKSRLN